MTKKILYLIRGIPGSGKTTLAKSIAFAASYPGVVEQVPHFAADQYFVNPETKEYKYDKSLISEAHSDCIRNTYAAMLDKHPIIIVSNCFVKYWELEPYYMIANKTGYHVIEIICRGNFKSIHDVPQATITRMKKDFQYV